MLRIRREGSIVSLLATLGLAACAETPTAVAPRAAGELPRFATTVRRYATFTPRAEADGTYLLPKACDVLIGEPILEPGDPPPTKYAHQLLVEVPEGATIRLVNDPSIRLPKGIERDVMLNAQGEPDSTGTVFGCDARDPDDPTQPVIDPVEGEPAKGNGPMLNTTGVTLDLNGYGIGSLFGAIEFDPLLENVAIMVLGDSVTVTNSSDVAADGVTGVSVISGFPDNIDIEAPNANVVGHRLDHDLDPLTPRVYNLVTVGGVRVRRSGVVVVDGLWSVDLDPVEGLGILLRDCIFGSSWTVRNSHLVGGSEEGVFIRECFGVTFEGNFISGPNGNGVTTREVVSVAGSPVIFRNNTIEGNALSGIVWGRDSRNVTGLTIVGNTFRDYGECGIKVATEDAPSGITPEMLAEWEQTNFFEEGATNKTCVEVDDDDDLAGD